MWFAPTRPTRADREDSACKACAVRGCPRSQAGDPLGIGDRRTFRAYAARQYALADTLQCPCVRARYRGFLI